MLCTRRLFGFPLSATLIVIAAIALSLFLLACGGGDTAPTQVPMSVPATPVPPATDPPMPATAVPAPTAPRAATGSPGSGVATPDSPTVPPTAAATVAPTVAPTEVLASNALLVLRRSCPEDFRQVLLDYDGDEFNAEIVRQLSDEFVELHPGCLAEGWDPEFPDEPEVCYHANTLDWSMSYKRNRRSELVYLLPTMRQTSRLSDSIALQVHFSRVPLLSMVPADMLPVAPGEVVGGCWSYSGDSAGGGRWTQSLIKYPAGAFYPNLGVRQKEWIDVSLNETLRYSYPECNLLLQEAISARLDAGEVPDASAVMDLVEEVRTQAGGGCDRDNPWSWMYAPRPVDGGAGGCPGTPLTGMQDNGDFVLNWGEYHFDGYGKSACWVRSAEGEWVGYLRE